MLCLLDYLYANIASCKSLTRTGIATVLPWEEIVLGIT